MEHSFDIKKATATKKRESFFAPLIQPKLSVNEPGNVYEQEADTVADRVMQSSESFVQTKPLSISGIQRKCAECEEEEKQMQRKEMNQGEVSAGNDLQNYVGSLDGGGQKLPEETRSFFEPKFGYDFSNVKIHTDNVAAKSAQSVNALAYTTGNNIVFNSGQYNPQTDSGKKLLAHELTHVVQQDVDISTKKIQRRVIDSHVVTTQAMTDRLGLTRQQIVDTITAADADAIVLAQAAEDALTTQLANAQNGDPVDPDTELILNEELGLSFNNAAQRGLIREQIRRFTRIRETLESGYLRYLAIGIGNVSIIGCDPEPCGTEFASSCPGNRLIVLCQTFWDTPAEQSATILHEPFHIWFSMVRHANNALRRADASCFESFALRVAGRAAFASCAGHTAG